MHASTAKARDTDRALTAFDALAAEVDVRVDGAPAGLLGRVGRASILQAAGRADDLQAAARDLAAGLASGAGRSPEISTRTTRRKWANGSATHRSRAPDDRLALAAAVDLGWQTWRRSEEGSPGHARETTWVDGRSILVLTRGDAGRLSALVVGPDGMRERWMAALPSGSPVRGVDLSLTDTADHLVTGHRGQNRADESVREAVASTLPWTVVAATGAHDRVRSLSPVARSRTV